MALPELTEEERLAAREAFFSNARLSHEQTLDLVSIVMHYRSVILSERVHATLAAPNEYADAVYGYSDLRVGQLDDILARLHVQATIKARHYLGLDEVNP